MIRNFKALGLALVAVLAMSALTASAAQAVGKFTWASGTQELTAVQDGTGATALQQFTTTSGSVECQEVSGKATVTGTEATEVTSENLAYSTCTDPFGGNATVAFNGCDYLFTVGETIGETGMETTGQAHIKCPLISGQQNHQQITVQGAGGLCQIHIPEQTPTGGHLIYHTVTGTPNHVTIEATVEGITYQGTFFCSSGTAGVYHGNVTVKGYNGATHDAAHQTSVEVH